MDRTVFLACLCAAVQGDIGEHVLIEEKKTWTEAQAYCQQHHTDLSYFNSQSEMDELPEITGGQFYAWIGLEQDPNNETAWRWSGGGRITFQNWEAREPDNVLGNEKNGFTDQNGQWYDYVDGRPLYFYCVNVTVVDEEKSWEDALIHCRGKRTHLPSLLSETDRLLAQTEIRKRDAVDRVWIGLRFLGDRWMWVNGDPLDYEAWSQDGGRDHQCPVRKRCGALTKEGLWENRDCQDHLRFICV